MRKFLLTALSILLVANVWAEDASHSFGIQLGFAQPAYWLNSPTAMGQSVSHLDKTVMNGFKVGFVYDASIVAGFGFSAGLNYTFATSRTGWNDYNFLPNGAPTLISQIEYATNYVYNQGEIFVDWQYKFEIAKQTFVILYSGPTIQLGGYSATDFFRYIADKQDVVMETVNWSYNDIQDNYLRRLNVTWGVGVGFQYKRYFLRGGYDFGIINPYKKISFNALDGVLFPGEDRYTRGRLDQWQIKLGIYLKQIE